MCPDEPTRPCPLPDRRDEGLDSGPGSPDILDLRLDPVPSPADYLAALPIANDVAKQQLGEAMLLSWCDRDRNFEAPQHVSECHRGTAVPGYVDYARSRGATLKIDIEGGRFVFFYRPVDF